MQGINGIETIVYGVEDVEISTRFFVDFGLPLINEAPEGEALFELEEGCSVIIRPLEKAVVEGQRLKGYGVQQIIWGVSSQKHLDRLVRRLEAHTKVWRDPDGTPRFFDCNGVACGLRVFNRVSIPGAPGAFNSHGTINRLNQQRKWHQQAKPKTIEHIVINTPDPEASFNWYRDMLDFRLSDIHETMGYFCRAPGHYAHHHIYFINANLRFLGMDGEVRFNHVMYGVEDLDEMMVGANHMERRGWPKSDWGLGRHRIGSSLHYYIQCPAGGEVEYGADSDCLDDNWVPRRWPMQFGASSYMHNIQPWWKGFQPWGFEYVDGYAPTDNAIDNMPIHGNTSPHKE